MYGHEKCWSWVGARSYAYLSGTQAHKLCTSLSFVSSTASWKTQISAWRPCTLRILTTLRECLSFSSWAEVSPVHERWPAPYICISAQRVYVCVGLQCVCTSTAVVFITTTNQTMHYVSRFGIKNRLPYSHINSDSQDEWITRWMGERATCMSSSSTAVENRASLVPRKRRSPGYREKNPTRVVGKPLPYCPRHIRFVVGESLSCAWVRQNARKYSRRHIRTMSIWRRFSWCIRVVW